MRKHHFNIRTVSLSVAVFARQDRVVDETNHDAFAYDVINAQASVIVDTEGVSPKPAANVLQA